MLPILLAPWGACLHIVPPTLNPADLCDQQRVAAVMVCDSHPAPLDHPLWGSRVPFHEEIQAAHGEALMERNWGLLPTVGTNMLAVGVSHLGGESSGPGQIFKWLQAQPTSDCNLKRALTAPETSQSQNYLVQLLHDSWSRETVTDSKWLMLF